MLMTGLSRREKAEALSAPSSSPTCPNCGRPVLRNHRCTSRDERKPMPADYREQVEAERRAAAIEQLRLFDDPTS